MTTHTNNYKLRGRRAVVSFVVSEDQTPISFSLDRFLGPEKKDLQLLCTSLNHLINKKKISNRGRLISEIKKIPRMDSSALSMMINVLNFHSWKGA